MRSKRGLWAGVVLAAAVIVAVLVLVSGSANSSPLSGSADDSTSTPIKHVVVIFQENESFDHYFGTYPNAVNPPPAEPGKPREPVFTPAPGTPAVNGLTPTLLQANPNLTNPVRLDRSEAVTCDMDHGYADEQKAYDNGLMDKFVEYTAGGGCTNKSMVMDYYDGNTVTGLWNLAQHYALSDNSYDTQFGPSTPGAINLISGETHGAEPALLPGEVENGTVISDPNPILDACTTGTIKMTGRNIGDMLNEKGVSWGWFQGGFAPSESVAGKPVCGAVHYNVAGAKVTDYSPHHNPFEYYASTANPEHLPPSSEAMIGKSDQANHEYDTVNFDEAVANGNLPAVSFVKAPEYQDGHPGYSDPIDEQAFIAEKLNEIENSSQWSSTAVVIAYDDSDGWYDHVMPSIVTPSKSASDFLSGTGECGVVTNGAEPPDRCGYGPRLPLMVISPYAKQNFVDDTLTDQTSIIKFVEENWGLGPISTTSADNKAGSLGNMFEFAADVQRAPKVFLDPATGLVTSLVEAPAPPKPSGSTTTPPSSGAPTPPPVVTPKPRPRVHCSVAGKDGKIKLTCSIQGGSGRGAVRFRLYRGKKMVETAHAAIRSDRAVATLTVKDDAAGHYRLVATVSREGQVTALDHGLHLPGKSSIKLR